MGLLDTLFGTPDVPKAPDYSPLINQAGGLANSATQNNAVAMGQVTAGQARVPTFDANSQWAQEMAQASQNLQQEQFDWAKQTYAENKGQTDKIVNMFTGQAAKQFGYADEDRARYNSDYVPLQKQAIDEANNYNTEGRRDLNRGRAMAGVGEQVENQRQNTMRDLESYGINPGAVRYAALDTGIRTAKAAAMAAAGTNSDLQTEQTARDLRDKAIAQGNLLPGQVAGEAGVGTNLGTGAVNSTLAQTASGANTMGKSTDYAQIAQGYEGQSTSALNGGTAAGGQATGALNAGTSALNAGTNATGTGITGTNTGFNNQQTAYTDATKATTGLGKLAGIGASAAMNYFAPGSSSFMAEGGEVPGGADEGAGRSVPMSASPSGGKAVDDVPARLTPGEFVIPKDVSSWMGEEKLQNIIRKAREAMNGGKGPGTGREAKPEMRSALPQRATFSTALPAR